MANAAIEGEKGTGATTAALYAICVGGCALAGWFSGGGAAPACLAACVSTRLPSQSGNVSHEREIKHVAYPQTGLPGWP